MARILTLIALAVSAFANDQRVSLQQAELEWMRTNQKAKLAEIYFLTSRCADIKKLKLKPNDLTCTCFKQCIKYTEVSKIEFLSEKLKQGKKALKNATVHKIIHELNSKPEIHYWLMKRLHNFDSERMLESLEVNPFLQ